MSDLKLFRVGDARIKELERRTDGIERSLQTLIESNLETLLGVRLVASEFAPSGLATDPIDTLGIDENQAPVVVKYRRTRNENVVTQGLYYLDWLNDHKEPFGALAGTALKPQPAADLYWPARRLICIAGDFNRFDRHAAAQMRRNIDLVEYCQFDIGFLMLSLTATYADPAVGISSGTDADSATARLEAAPKAVFDLFQGLRHFVKALGDDVQCQALKDRFAFRRMKTFAWVIVQPEEKQIQLQFPMEVAALAPSTDPLADDPELAPTTMGGQALILREPGDLEGAKAFLQRSYQRH
ncbi:MAG: DUF5655 domain-containing protein [Desulfosarcinaceae bacterium]|nr:DUF5655 domain-containing protein [Desulfosarcinaceae bacterium]